MIKKRYMSLLEIMIVILLIGIISSVVGFNVKGSLEKGKVFKTRQAKDQIRDLLLLEVADGAPLEMVVQNPLIYLKNSGVLKNSEDFIRDGWGEEFIIEGIKNNTDIRVTSKKLDNYDQRVRSQTSKIQQSNEQDQDDYTVSE